MTTIPDSLGMKPVAHTWYEPIPGTRADRIRTTVRWAFWSTVLGAPSIGLLVLADYYGSL